MKIRGGGDVQTFTRRDEIALLDKRGQRQRHDCEPGAGASVGLPDRAFGHGAGRGAVSISQALVSAPSVPAFVPCNYSHSPPGRAQESPRSRGRALKVVRIVVLRECENPVTARPLPIRGAAQPGAFRRRAEAGGRIMPVLVRPLSRGPPAIQRAYGSYTGISSHTDAPRRAVASPGFPDCQRLPESALSLQGASAIAFRAKEVSPN